MSLWRISVLALFATPTFDALLLPPVDNQITFWAKQPGYYALIGVARDSSVHLVYHDALFARLGYAGYVYVPVPDTGYARIYFLASPMPLDLSALEHEPSAYALGRAIASAPIVEGYDRPPERVFFVLANPNHHTSHDRVVQIAASRDAWLPDTGVRRKPYYPPDGYDYGSGYIDNNWYWTLTGAWAGYTTPSKTAWP
jgi:hypothetical protein